MKQRTREDKHKELIQRHLPYEVTTMGQAYAFIGIKSNEINRFLAERNCYIESFAIHARGLLEFFQVIKLRKGAIASDYTVQRVRADLRAQDQHRDDQEAQLPYCSPDD